MEPTRLQRAEATIFVHVRGKKLSMEVCLDETVLDLKRKIQAQEGLPVHQYFLLFANRQLEDDWTLRRSGVTNSCTVIMFQKLHGGGGVMATDTLLPGKKSKEASFRSSALLKKKCKSCIGETLPEVMPEIVPDPERNKTTYRAHLPHAGSFHCAETGLGFEVSAAVTVEYSYGSWAESLSPSAQENWMVAGPLFHIRAEPHRVRAVHLPHFLCLADGADESLCCIAHFEAGRMTSERPTRINSFFAVLENPRSSQLGVLWRKLQYDYVLRSQAIEEQTKWESTHVLKPPQTDPLYFGSRYQVSGLENLDILPAQLDFCYRSPREQQSYVEIYTQKIEKEIRLWVHSQDDDSLVWEGLVRLGDVRYPTLASLELKGAVFVEKHRRQLRDRMGQLEAMLARFREAQLLSSEEEEEVKSHRTSQRRNDALLQPVERKGAWARAELYRTLKEIDPYLVQDLKAFQDGASEGSTSEDYSRERSCSRCGSFFENFHSVCSSWQKSQENVRNH